MNKEQVAGEDPQKVKKSRESEYFLYFQSISEYSIFNRFSFSTNRHLASYVHWLQISLEEFGEPRNFNLKEGGASIPVTNENREEFVKLYLDFVLNTAIYEQFRAFYLGFHSVCASNALIVSTAALFFSSTIYSSDWDYIMTIIQTCGFKVVLWEIAPR